MSYLLFSKNPLKPNWRISFKIAIFLLVAFLAVLNLTGANKKIKNLCYQISSPIQRFFWKGGDKLSDFFSTIFQIKMLKEENENLKLKIHQLMAENTELYKYEKENEILREALGFGLGREFEVIQTQIISKDVQGDSILIDKGKRDGIEENMPVITAQKVLVGKVSEVFEKHARVMLISNKKSSLNGTIQEKDIDGIIQGKGFQKISFEFIPRDKLLEKEDIVITSQLKGVFPNGLLIGKVLNVKKSDTEPFQSAELEPFFDIKATDTFFIITNF